MNFIETIYTEFRCSRLLRLLEAAATHSEGRSYFLDKFLAFLRSSCSGKFFKNALSLCLFRPKKIEICFRTEK